MVWSRLAHKNESIDDMRYRINTPRYYLTRLSSVVLPGGSLGVDRSAKVSTIKDVYHLMKSIGKKPPQSIIFPKRVGGGGGGGGGG